MRRRTPGSPFRRQRRIAPRIASGVHPRRPKIHAVCRNAKPSPSGPQSGVNPRLVDLRANSSAEAANGFWICRRDGGKTRLGITNGAEGEAATLAWDGKPGLVEVVYSGNQVWSHRLNGVPDGGGTFAGSTFQGLPPEGVRLSVGQADAAEKTAADTFFSGDLAELIVYQRTLNEAERHQVGYYLERKYGLDTVYGPPPLFERDVLRSLPGTVINVTVRKFKRRSSTYERSQPCSVAARTVRPLSAAIPTRACWPRCWPKVKCPPREKRS